MEATIYGLGFGLSFSAIPLTNDYADMFSRFLLFGHNTNEKS